MIRKIRKEDKNSYLDMAKNFYSSEAVHHDVPEINFVNTFNEMMRSDNYVSGYIMEYGNHISGYALLAKAFSQEAGGMVLWIDELYVLPEYRCRGLGHEFFLYLKNHLPEDVKRVRLEVAKDNEKAMALYRSMGFEDLPYLQMIIDSPNWGPDDCRL